MGRGNLQKRAQREYSSEGRKYYYSGSVLRNGEDLTDVKRKRPTRNQAPSTLPNVDIHGILFAIVAIVFVVYPLAQSALGR